MLPDQKEASMEASGVNERSSGSAIGESDPRPGEPAPSISAGVSAVTAQTCSSCGREAPLNGSVASPSFVYAVGKIEPRFPRLSVEKEFAQVIGRDETAGLTDRQGLHKVLSKLENRYLARQMCWILTISGIETYILFPRDPADFSLLIESLRSAPKPADIDVVIGVRGATIAPPEMCNGLMVPVVAFDQIYSFDREGLVGALPRPEEAKAEEFTAAAEELFDRLMRITDNAGATDEHRALNYLAMRYHSIYTQTSKAFARNASLSSVDVRSSPLSATRNILDVIFTYTDRASDVTEKFSVRVDVTEEFPFLVTKLSPYFDR
jgi:hypothetical protein